MSHVQTLIKNTSSFTLALVLQKVLAFIFFALLARFLSVESLGQYVFVISFVTMFGLIIDFGTNHYITREVAKNADAAQSLFSRVLGFKCIAAIVAIIAVSIATWLLGYDHQTSVLIFSAVGIMLFESLSLTVYAVLRGFQALRYESMITVMTHSVILAAGAYTASVTGSVLYLILVVTAAYIFHAGYGLYIVYTKYDVRPRLILSYAAWKQLFLLVFPFALAAGFARIYGAFDQIMLSKLSEAVYLGYYAVSYKLTFSLQFIPLALMAAMYPVFSSRYASDQAFARRLFATAVSFLMYVSIPVSILVLFFAPTIIRLIYGDAYSGSVLPLQALIVSLVFLFINFPIGSLLNATNNQAKQTRNIGIALLLNILLNAVFISRFDAVGAALASSVSTCVLTCLGVMTLRFALRFPIRQQFKEIYRHILPTGGMVIVLLFMSLGTMHWLLQSVISTGIYVLLGYMSGVWSWRHIQTLIGVRYETK